jgi:probable H4MPT-linked C1 transfer pathway protein
MSFQLSGYAAPLKYITGMAADSLGLDIGGANLKAATSDGGALSRRFELWKHPEQLPQELAKIAAELPCDGPVAVTMTGELCDCFETKRDGVRYILASAVEVFGEPRIRVWSTAGQFVTIAQANESPMRVAAANWHALATFAGRFAPIGPAILIDIGSTTTDVIPLLDGKPVPTRLTDPERLESRELVYTGVRRTPVCAFMGPRGAAELFATTHDVYLLLGLIPEDPSDLSTADGRPATVDNAHARLARMLGGDIEITGRTDTIVLAKRVFGSQRLLIADALDRVTSRLRKKPRVLILSGAGEFLAQRSLDYLESKLPRLSIGERLGPQLSQAACAYALAILSVEVRE